MLLWPPGTAAPRLEWPALYHTRAWLQRGRSRERGSSGVVVPCPRCTRRHPSVSRRACAPGDRRGHPSVSHPRQPVHGRRGHTVAGGPLRERGRWHREALSRSAPWTSTITRAAAMTTVAAGIHSATTAVALRRLFSTGSTSLAHRRRLAAPRHGWSRSRGAWRVGRQKPASRCRLRRPGCYPVSLVLVSCPCRSQSLSTTWPLTWVAAHGATTSPPP